MGHILLVGGDRQHVDTLRNASQLTGHHFAICHDPLDAIRHARTHPVDVLITDPTTGVDQDLALVEELKSLWPDVRAIVLAPAVTNAEILNTLKAQVFACFREPLRTAEIAEMTRAALEASDWRWH